VADLAGGTVPDCIFCKIVRREIPANEVKRSADAVAFRDLNPQAPQHVLVIPTTHVAAVRDAAGAVVARTFAFAAEVARDLGLDAGGYRLVTNTGPDAGQSVDHLHIHLLGGRRLGWPPG
jgi:histidine triad (HIT) family protein